MLMRIILREGHDREICTRIKVHMALKNIAKNFFAVSLLDFDSNYVTIKGEGEIEALEVCLVVTGD